MADPQPHGRPPDAGTPHESPKNPTEMAPRQAHADSNQSSEPSLDGSQAGYDHTNTLYGYKGATYSTSTSRDAPMRPNIAPYWGGQDIRPDHSEHQVADKSSTCLTEDEKRSTIKSIDDPLSSIAAPDLAHAHRNSVAEVSAAMGEMMKVLRTMQRTMQEINDKNTHIALAQAPASGLDMSKSALAHDAPHAAQCERLSTNEIRRLRSALSTPKPPRVVLDWEKIYPELYPSALTPLPKQLVGGVGWSLGAPCAACVKNRPDKTKWISFEEASKVPEYIGLDGCFDARRLSKDTAILHNPGRCWQLHKDVNEHIAANPSDMWMLKERLLSARRP